MTPRLSKLCSALMAVAVLQVIGGNVASAQSWSVVSIPLPQLQEEGNAVFEPVLPGSGRQLVVRSDRGIDVLGAAVDSGKWASLGKLQTGGRTGRLGFVRLEREGPRTPVLLDIEGVWKLSLDHPPEKLLERRPAIPATPNVHFGVVGWDFHGDGIDELLFPEESGYTALQKLGSPRPESIRLPARLRQPRLTLETDDGMVNPVLPASRRLDLGRFQGVDTLAFLPAVDGFPSALVLSTAAEFGTRIRHEIVSVKSGPELTGKPHSTNLLPTDPLAEDLPIRMADGRIRIVRTRGNLDLLQPRTDVTLHEDGTILGRWTSRDPIGLGAVQTLADGQGPSLILATLSLQAGSVPDMAGMVSGKPLQYRLLFFAPTADGRAWSKEGQPGPELAIVVDPSQPRIDPPFHLRDLTGDGLADIISRVSPTHIQVHVAKEAGVYSSTPGWEMDVEPDSALDFVDVDGNGAEDLILSSRKAALIQIAMSRTLGDRSLLRRLHPQRLLPGAAPNPVESPRP